MILGLAIGGIFGGLANAAEPRQVFPRANALQTLVGDPCRPIADRISEARDLLNAIPRSTSLDTTPSAVPTVWFKTNAADIDIPTHLRSEYPTDMAIILEYSYRNLAVTDAFISVTVSFRALSG